ncbi:MAG TPA: hypothetical protein VI603_09435 [Saprospiraceae bacterium]|nr:hypothetical protein [Saprospiraceae bacterium]
MKWLPYISVALVVIATQSCLDHDKDSAAYREKIVTEGIQIRISEFRQREWSKCLEQARIEAVVQVDSLIRAGAREDAIEPVIKPPKPERPEKPETRKIPDSLKVKAKRDSIEQKDIR